jgi:hypothetical protein
MRASTIRLFVLLLLLFSLHNAWGGGMQALGVCVPDAVFDDGDAGTFIRNLANRLFAIDMHLWWGVGANDEALMETDMSGNRQLIGTMRQQLGLTYMEHFLYDPLRRLTYLPFAPFFGMEDEGSDGSMYDLGLILENDPAQHILRPLTICTTHRRYSRWWSRNMLYVLPWVLVELAMGLLWRMEKRFGVLCTHNCFPFVHLGAYAVNEMEHAESLSMRLSMHGMELRRDQEVS